MAFVAIFSQIKLLMQLQIKLPQVLRNLSKNAFKRKLAQILFNILGSQDSYIDLSQIIKNVKSR